MKAVAQEAPSLTASDLHRNITRLEHRVPTTSVRILEERGTPWDGFRENPKVLHPEVVRLVEAAFDEGAFVAGGCARWLRHQPVVTPFLRGSYVKAGGDLDLFFRSELGWERFVDRAIGMTALEGSRLKVTMSKGNLAANIVMHAGHSYQSAPPVQAICCTVSEPEAMLRGFDFVNAMTAFDREKTWVAEGWEEHEASKTLAVAWWGSRAIAHRAVKYVQKYAYTTLRDVSDGRMVEQLTAGYDAMGKARQVTTAATWRELLRREGLHLSMETKLTILSAATDGLDAKDIYDSSKETAPGGLGTYEYVMNDLLRRQEQAREASLKKTQQIPIDRDMWTRRHELDVDDACEPFDVDEYCWAI